MGPREVRVTTSSVPVLVQRRRLLAALVVYGTAPVLPIAAALAFLAAVVLLRRAFPEVGVRPGAGAVVLAAVTLLTAALVLRMKWNPFWLLAAGAVIGISGLV